MGTPVAHRSRPVPSRDKEWTAALSRTQASFWDGILGVLLVCLPRKRVWWSSQTDRRKGMSGAPGNPKPDNYPQGSQIRTGHAAARGSPLQPAQTPGSRSGR